MEKKMNYDRVYNFSAGPSMLPEKVLEQVRDDLLNYRGTGESVMEMSHRSKEYMAIIEDAEQDLRDLLEIPDNYKVLFIQGGATTQFSMVPLNLMRDSHKADYVVTGSWAKKAMKEAKKFGDVKVAASSEDSTFTYIPELTREDFRSDADYVHICFNNTIYGSHYPYIPDTGSAPIKCCSLSFAFFHYALCRPQGGFSTFTSRESPDRCAGAESYLP